jgi:hypothetical protein
MATKTKMKARTGTGRWLLRLVFLGIFVSGGVLWYLLPGSDDELPHRLSGVFRQWHGAFAILSTLFIGYMLADHILPKMRRSLHWDGVLHLVVWGVLIASGYLLYYPQEIISAAINVSVLHWAIGLGLGAVFPLHVSRKIFVRYLRKRNLNRIDSACSVSMQGQTVD